MPNLVNLESVGKAYGTTVLFDGVSLGLGDRDRVGVVGRNGGGKTTLARMISGAEPPDTGRVTHAGGLTWAHLAQEAALPAGATVRQLVLGDRPEHEWAADPRRRAVVDGLGLPALAAGLDTPVETLSGGERRRTALAAALVGEPDLLILDEPTNHLDVEGIAWLADYLTGAWRGALLVVTHDRWFLDAVCETTWEVGDATVHAYDGGYSAYVLAKAERTRIAAVTEARRQNLLRKELAWLRRGPPARTSKPRFRIEAASALIADEPPARDSVALRRFATARLGRSVYDVEDATVRLGERVLFDRVTWRIGPGDRFGVVGVNGAGKTTLLRLLVGEVAAAEGQVRAGRTVRPAYLSQTVAELPPGARVLPVVEEVARRVDLGDGRELTASQLLERFGFGAARQWTPVDDLSGGERRRLQLLRLLMAEPNVLLLDEPTNDLDIETLTALEDLLDGWPGVLVVVSHDRYFLERVTDRTLALLGDGSLAELPGGVDEYLARRRASSPQAQSAPPGRRRSGDSRAARKELTRLERHLEKLAREEERLHALLAEHATDYEKVAGYDEQLRALAAERADVEERWLELAEDVEAGD